MDLQFSKVLFVHHKNPIGTRAEKLEDKYEKPRGNLAITTGVNTKERFAFVLFRLDALLDVQPGDLGKYHHYLFPPPVCLC